MPTGKTATASSATASQKENVLSTLGLSAEQLNEEKLYILVPDYRGYEQDLSDLLEWAASDFDGSAKKELLRERQTDIQSWLAQANEVWDLQDG